MTDVKGGDYIFLCSDGVLEQLTNIRIVEILSMDCSDKEKLRLLESESTDKTKDNYTAYLIPIDKVLGVSLIEQEEEVSAVVIETATSISRPIGTTSISAQSHIGIVSKKFLKTTRKKYFVIVVIILLFLIFCFSRYFSKVTKKTESRKTEMIHFENPGKEPISKPIDKSNQDVLDSR